MVGTRWHLQSVVRPQHNYRLSPLPLLFGFTVGVLAKHPGTNPDRGRREIECPSARACPGNAASESKGTMPEGAGRWTHADVDAVGPGRSDGAVPHGRIDGANE